MEEYVVSARKYRPLNFDSVVGQQALTTTLKNSIATGKLAHAYLFCGPRGVGKTTCARIFAKAINCLNPQEGGDACGKCESCMAFDQQRSMNIHELDAASNNSVEDIRELCKQVLIPPQIGRYKVFIIDEVHMLSSAAFNAFLKTLEEPPSYVIFILATTEKHKILPTILSRCQVYDFQRITTQGMVEHLLYVAQKEGYSAEPEALGLIAEKADGGMRDALSIFDQMVSFTGGELTYDRVCKNLNVLSTEYYFRFVEYFLSNDVQNCLLLLNEILQKGFDGGNMIAGLATHMRNLLVSHDEVTLPLLEMSQKMRERYQKQAKRCPIKFLYKSIKLCNDCDQAYRTSRNKRLQLEITMIQAAQLTEEDSPAAGLCPNKILKPIFSENTEKSSISETQQTLPQVQTQVADKPTSTIPLEQKTHIVETTQPTNTENSAPQVTNSIRKKVSFKSLGTKKVKENEHTEFIEEPESTLETPLEIESTRVAWQTYINSMPHEQTAIAQRMRSLQPTIHCESTIQIEATNQQIQNELNSIKPQLETFLKKQLKNCKLQLVILLASQEEIHQVYSKNEHLKILTESNPNVKSLVERLQLEIN